MRELTYLKDVVTLDLNSDKCVGCGMCRAVCPHAVFILDNGLSRIAARDACMECGACARNCPVSAIYVKTGEGCAKAIINEMLQRECECC